MKIKSRHKGDADLYEYMGTNMLYELVNLYGAYIEYTNKIDENEFVAFYNNTKERILYRYINLANNEVKKYLLKRGTIVTSRKLKRIIITGKRAFVYSYSWMPLYVEYVINKIFENDVLTKYVVEYIMKKCDYFDDCHNMDSKELQIVICKKVLLGFQFNFLETVKENYSERKSRVAEKILNEISANTIKVVDSCSDKIE
jgi:hypothetical protein